MKDEHSDDELEPSAPESPGSWIRRFNDRVEGLVRLIGNVKTLVAAVAAVSVVTFAVIRGDGWEHFQGWMSGDTTETRDYQPVPDRYAHSFIAVEGILESEGVTPPVEEFSVWRDDDGVYHYRWQHDGDERIFSANRDSDGSWLVNEER